MLSPYRLPSRWVPPFLAALTLLVWLPSGHTTAPVAYHRVLFVGDSITYHQAAPSLDWSGTWGMAATAEDRDYVHVFLKKLSDAQHSAPESLVMAKGGGKLAGQLALSKQMTDYRPDLAIVQMGENDADVSDAGFRKPYADILAAIRAGNPDAKILCLGVWGPPNGGRVQDGMIREACKACGATFVDTAAINKDLQAQAKSTGLFTHNGVQWHPSDYGMAKYAAALWAALANPVSAGGNTIIPVTGAQGKILVKEDWEPNSQVEWIPARPSIEKIDGVQTAKMITPRANDSNMVQVVLNPAEITGKELTVKTRVKGSGISKRPEPYNGVKIILHLRNAEGVDDYPQETSLPDGTFDWKEVDWRVHIPDNVVTAELGIGLENVQGTLWVAPISITAQN